MGYCGTLYSWAIAAFTLSYLFACFCMAVCMGRGGFLGHCILLFTFFVLCCNGDYLH